MSDRFYLQQLNKTGHTRKNKPTRKYKKDYISEIHRLLGSQVSGLDSCTIKSLDELTKAIKNATT